MRTQTCSVLLVGTLIGLLAAPTSFAETVAERFEKAMKKKAEYCATHKIDPANRRCDILKLKPADPLATEEGRFAHSIKIPNPVSEDSGYKPGMTSEQYFDHLCKTEAGEFIYKTVENVDGIYMMRPREKVWDDHQMHLYALEDPYGYADWESTDPGGIFVGPARYKVLEMPITSQREMPSRREFIHPSRFAAPPADSRYQRYFGYDGRDLKSLQVEYSADRNSQYGYTWRGIARPHDRELGIAGGELIVLDLRTNEVLAVRRGYIRSGDVRNNMTSVWWLGGHVCQSSSARLFRTFEFLAKILRPVNSQSKENSNAAK